MHKWRNDKQRSNNKGDSIYWIQYGLVYTGYKMVLLMGCLYGWQIFRKSLCIHIDRARSMNNEYQQQWHYEEIASQGSQVRW